ncbi:MAG TPA: hypothetical protein VKF17_06020 [Isosphaeraceae bacterium]|nr:hypothetical protein [Isosphaeraceae bacterium]
MSGPIIRKYGFPNFEKIFGKRPLEHGVDEPEKNECAVEGDAKPLGSTPASGAVPKATPEAAARRQVSCTREK